MQDTFFTQSSCDRCGKDLHVRSMSWFTTETICDDCINAETQLKKSLDNNGSLFEGCGYIPKVEKKIVNISDQFHDDSFEGYNFWRATQDDSVFLGSGEEFKRDYPKLVKQVEEAMERDAVYILLDDDTEIQWG